MVVIPLSSSPRTSEPASAEPGSSTYAKTRSVLFIVFKKRYRQKAAPFDSGAGYRICVRCAHFVRYDDADLIGCESKLV